MFDAISKYFAATAVMSFLLGCSGTAANHPPTDPQPSEADTAQETAPGKSDTGATVSTADDAEAPEKETETSCNGKPCEPGQRCIEYYGFAGNRLYICGIPCRKGEPNDGCPEDRVCQVSPDGPTLCVER